MYYRKNGNIKQYKIINKVGENNESISENKLIEIINEKLNLSNITRLELENKVKCIYIDKNKNVKIDIK